MQDYSVPLNAPSPYRMRMYGLWAGILLSAGLLTTEANGAISTAPSEPAAHQAEAAPVSWDVPPAFTQGMTAITQGDNAAVAADISALGDQPLATFLQFRWLMDTVNQNPVGVVDFLKAHPGYLFSKDLKLSLLKSLQLQGAWANYLDALALSPELKSSTRLTCNTLQAAVETRTMTPERILAAEHLWVQGRSQPDYCDPVFTWLQNNDHLTAELYRERIRAAVLAGNLSLGQYLVRSGTAQKVSGLDVYFKGWRAVEEAPEQTVRTALTQQSSQKITSVERAHLVRALMRLARIDPQSTHDLLGQIPAVWAIDDADQDQIARQFALKAAYTRMPQAYDWLKALPDSVQNEETLTWRARAALRVENWQNLKEAIAAMPVDLAQESEWQYWWARADAALGETKAADARWRALLHEPDYYGFLAADRLGMAYPWAKHPPLPKVSTSTVAAIPAVQLAFYLRAAGLTDDARRAFGAALNDVPSDQLPALTVLAEQAQWYDRVSITIAKMHKQNDPAWFAARFPMPWPNVVAQQAKAQGVDANWLYAMIRRESLFMSDVGSGVGAQGLMQLMPRTASWINRKADLGLNNLDLHDPATSITLGSAYLSYLRDRFPGQLPLAIAAYNAGPGRVKQWLPETQIMPGDVWVDTILFDETRNYVRAVLAATVIYAWRDQPHMAAGQAGVVPSATAMNVAPTPAVAVNPHAETLASLLTPIQPVNPVPPATEDAAIPSPSLEITPVAAISPVHTAPSQ
ncbi:MAG: transglycosylase SLT domain-containing protein [Halothiobacillus sp.]|nr:transglycosylase SLT domain-containing protein [Halothiobacillus sp.]